jgi:hypothetical protein
VKSHIESKLRIIAGGLAMGIAVVMLSTSVGCKTPGADGQPGWPAFRYQQCSVESPCPEPFLCDSGHCVTDDGRYVMTTTTCASNEGCAFGMICLENACAVDVIECANDFDCTGDRECISGECVDVSTCEYYDDYRCVE